MADLVFVRANVNAPIKEGTVVNLGPGTGICSYARPDQALPPSGLAFYAQAVLSNRFNHQWYYYAGVTGVVPANPVQPVF